MRGKIKSCSPLSHYSIILAIENSFYVVRSFRGFAREQAGRGDDKQNTMVFDPDRYRAPPYQVDHIRILRYLADDLGGNQCRLGRRGCHLTAKTSKVLKYYTKK